MAEPWAPPRPPTPTRRAGRGRIVFWVLTGIAAACLVGSLAAVGVTTRVYTNAAESMENTLQVGDRLPVASGDGVRRGDIVVMQIPVHQSGAGELVVKRLIGLPGDHVACCTAGGKVTVNGKPLDETYVYPGNEPSTIRFSVTLGHGMVWVMGDHRLVSLDSREWGPVPQSDIVGPVLTIMHGSSFRSVQTPRTFVADGLAPGGARTPVYTWLLMISGIAIVMLIALLIIGITRTIIRRRRGANPPPL